MQISWKKDENEKGFSIFHRQTIIRRCIHGVVSVFSSWKQSTVHDAQFSLTRVLGFIAFGTPVLFQITKKVLTFFFFIVIGCVWMEEFGERDLKFILQIKFLNPNTT